MYHNERLNEMILSRVRGSVINNNGFWIGWLDLLALLLQLQSIIRAHKRWLPKTRSIPYWTTSVFSSTVTDLVLIYESVTSSASSVRWLTHVCAATDKHGITWTAEGNVFYSVRPGVIKVGHVIDLFIRSSNWVGREVRMQSWLSVQLWSVNSVATNPLPGEPR
jgi:hypothetical protein